MTLREKTIRLPRSELDLVYLARRDVVALLAAVLPYMRIKREEARSALDYALDLLAEQGRIS